MKNENTFDLHFILRMGSTVRDKFSVYARIVVNNSRCELALKSYVRKEEWNSLRGAGKPLNEELKQLNSYLEEVRGKLVKHYVKYTGDKTCRFENTDKKQCLFYITK